MRMNYEILSTLITYYCGCGMASFYKERNGVYDELDDIDQALDIIKRIHQIIDVPRVQYTNGLKLIKKYKKQIKKAKNKKLLAPYVRKLDWELFKFRLLGLRGRL